MKAEINRLTIEKFFRTEYHKLLNYVRKNIEDRFFRSSPEDIVQDVALSLLSKLDLDMQIENLAGYVYRSLKNRTIDNNRQRFIPISTDDIENRNQDLLKIASISDEAEKDFLEETGISREQLYEGISKLKPDEQAIIMLTEFEGRSFAELSNSQNVPIGTLLSRKHRALAKLYKILTRKDYKTTTKIEYDENKRILQSERKMAL